MSNRLLHVAGIIVLFLSSMPLAERLRPARPVESVGENTPDWFDIVVYRPPDGIALQSYSDLRQNPRGDAGSSYLFPMEKVKFLNQKLARQYTGHGGTWEFAILKETSGRQYIQVTESGSASILECWYWASVDKVEPDKVKRITAGHSMEVVQLATFITLGGGLIYLFIRILARWIL